MAVIATVLLLIMQQPGAALINIGLQPTDLFERYGSVIAGRVVKVEADNAAVTLRVTTVFKGDHKADDRIAAHFESALEELVAEAVRTGDLRPEEPFVAFVSSAGRRGTRRVMLYANGFFLGEVTSEAVWRLSSGDAELADTAGESIPSLAGTWNGTTAQLIALLTDIVKEREFFPRQAYARFARDILLDRFEGEPPRGVALYDVDGDGDLDVYVASYGGDRIYLQMKPMVFVNATEWVGLETESASVSAADVDLDGHADLLVDGVILRGGREDAKLRFKSTDWLPEEANEQVKAAAFAEVNGDGYPDVIISHRDGGLRVCLNPGETGGAFTDATEAMGLARAEHGAGQDGYFAVGDWNDDGKADLFYAVGDGLLLVQNDKGVFERVNLGVKISMESGEDEVGETGAGFFAPVVGQARQDLVVPTASGWHVIENRDGKPIDVTEYGNEISEGSHLHLATVAADLNVDGYLDLYTISRARNGHNRFIVNRGYGSFMLADMHKYYAHMFDGPAHITGGSGIAVGDINGDGAPDLVLTNSQGAVSIVLNETLALRQPTDHPTRDWVRLLGTRVLRVTLSGPRGVVGARVTLHDATGHLLLRRDIGVNVATGCRSADEAVLAVRDADRLMEAGPLTLRVRFADGLTRTTKVTLERPTQHLHIGRDGEDTGQPEP